MKIRQASESDLDAIGRIYGHYVISGVATFDERPPSLADWQGTYSKIVAAGLPFLVAEDEGQVIGYAFAKPWRDRPAYRATAEESIYLAPEAAGKGAGTALLTRLLEDCARCGIAEVLAVVVDSGEPASLRLHRRCGFVETGRLARVGRKHGRVLDTVLLQCSLDTPLDDAVTVGA
ncbi:GNAT family N-acetyltransferase [Allokutzneria albata]|uniref:Phosphinothricin acetyltransferase n=1 Tax=Allokutzneria albata TaxID=211114 RepID=A0A1G9UZJ2_ALLAB|nr:GNAT family N-acetyltransferase [Allokutzneria albata]SDM65279.1 phosphinothricin acetyltransferase [Allokutzneria albata]